MLHDTNLYYGYTVHDVEQFIVCLEYNKDRQAYLLFHNSNGVFLVRFNSA